MNHFEEAGVSLTVLIFFFNDARSKSLCKIEMSACSHENVQVTIK